ncbi:lysophospholipid transporter LplT [Brevibacillus dissolubilis]|uniref:lysophospholipid transporter LplT n=1 Tax=Brevibacillus dissolubilis TaxID=1844116 RepID=UPI00210052D4|nr:lysophospholipid transporter LplT [Brevibacillus dissolubilis]
MMRLQPLPALYTTQFLSAFADNMILFVIANLLGENGFSAGALALVSMAFFIPYLLLAPWVGPFADKHPKSVVLMIGNLIKALGVVLLLIVPHNSILMLMLAYFTVGVGAVVYSPAKYGILPELTENEEELFQANARIEGFTILAILAGIGGGGAIAAATTTVTSSIMCLVLFGLSFLMTFWIPRTRSQTLTMDYRSEARQFFTSVKVLMQHPSTNFSLVGTGSFWMSSAVLRIAVLAWIPVALGFNPKDFAVSLILATTSIGIIAGALLAPKLVPLRYFYRSSWYGLLMMVLIFIFPWVHVTWLTVLFLLAVGFMGGAYIVPMNTVLQEEGMKLVGAGKTIAVQNFVENGLMLIGSAIYYAVTFMQLSISGAIVVQGVIFLGFLIYLRLKVDQIKRSRSARLQ